MYDLSAGHHLAPKHRIRKLSSLGAVLASLSLALLLLVCLPGTANAEAGRSHAGMLLVAEPELADPNFARTVVYLLEHDEEGALGLVINRRLGERPLGRILEGMGLEGSEDTGAIEVFYGGPVEPQVGMVLHGDDYSREDTSKLTDGLAVTGSPEILRDIAKGKGPGRFVFTLGYAGWGPGQLDAELARGGWFLIPAEPDLIFSDNPEKTWERALERRGFRI